MSEPIFQPYNLEGYDRASGFSDGRKQGFTDGLYACLGKVVEEMESIFRLDKKEHLINLKKLYKKYKKMSR